jgi:hypothetical protein
MELREFVKAALVEVIAGIRDAQETEFGAYIVPRSDGGHKYASNDRFSESARLKSTIVDFDIALTTEDSSSVGAGGGIKVLGVGAGVKGDKASRDMAVSRIQFAIPLLLPESEKEWYVERAKETGAG